MRHLPFASAVPVLLLAAAPSFATGPKPARPADPSVGVQLRGTTTPVAAAAPSKSALVCKGLTVAGRGGPRTAPRKRGVTTLSARAVEDASFTLTLGRVRPGEHVVELRLFMPGGGLYQSLTSPVAFPAGARWTPEALSAAGSHRRVEGYPFPVAVQRPDVAPGDPGASAGSGARASVSLSLPVAGTPIVNSSLYGDWKVRAYVDGAENACRTATFRITQ